MAADDLGGRFMALAGARLTPSFRLAAHLLGDRTEADDAVQEALLAAWRAWPKLRDPERFDAWLERIVVNTCFERLRRRRRTPVEILPIELGGGAGEGSAALLARDEVGRALARLSPEHRVAVVLRFWRDLSVEEIADRTGVPSGTVRSRLHYALRALRAELEPAAGEGEGAR